MAHSCCCLLLLPKKHALYLYTTVCFCSIAYHMATFAAFASIRPTVTISVDIITTTLLQLLLAVPDQGDCSHTGAHRCSVALLLLP